MMTKVSGASATALLLLVSTPYLHAYSASQPDGNVLAATAPTSGKDAVDQTSSLLATNSGKSGSFYQSREDNNVSAASSHEHTVTSRASPQRPSSMDDERRSVQGDVALEGSGLVGAVVSMFKTQVKPPKPKCDYATQKYFERAPSATQYDKMSGILGVGTVVGNLVGLASPAAGIAFGAMTTGISTFMGVGGMYEEPSPNMHDMYACVQQQLKELERRLNEKLDKLRKDMEAGLKAVVNVAASNRLLIFVTAVESIKMDLNSKRQAAQELYDERTVGLDFVDEAECERSGMCDKKLCTSSTCSHPPTHTFTSEDLLNTMQWADQGWTATLQTSNLLSIMVREMPSWLQTLTDTAVPEDARKVLQMASLEAANVCFSVFWWSFQQYSSLLDLFNKMVVYTFRQFTAKQVRRGEKLVTVEPLLKGMTSTTLPPRWDSVLLRSVGEEIALFTNTTELYVNVTFGLQFQEPEKPYPWNEKADERDSWRVDGFKQTDPVLLHQWHICEETAEKPYTCKTNPQHPFQSGTDQTFCNIPDEIINTHSSPYTQGDAMEEMARCPVTHTNKMAFREGNNYELSYFMQNCGRCTANSWPKTVEHTDSVGTSRNKTVDGTCYPGGRDYDRAKDYAHSFWLAHGSYSKLHKGLFSSNHFSGTSTYAMEAKFLTLKPTAGLACHSGVAQDTYKTPIDANLSPYEAIFYYPDSFGNTQTVRGWWSTPSDKNSLGSARLHWLPEEDAVTPEERLDYFGPLERGKEYKVLQQYAHAKIAGRPMPALMELWARRVWVISLLKYRNASGKSAATGLEFPVDNFGNELPQGLNWLLGLQGAACDYDYDCASGSCVGICTDGKNETVDGHGYMTNHKIVDGNGHISWLRDPSGERNYHLYHKDGRTVSAQDCFADKVKCPDTMTIYECRRAGMMGGWPAVLYQGITRSCIRIPGVLSNYTQYTAVTKFVKDSSPSAKADPVLGVTIWTDLDYIYREATLVKACDARTTYEYWNEISQPGQQDPTAQVGVVICCDYSTHETSYTAHRHSTSGECYSGQVPARVSWADARTTVSQNVVSYFEAERTCAQDGRSLCQQASHVHSACHDGCAYDGALAWLARPSSNYFTVPANRTSKDCPHGTAIKSATACQAALDALSGQLPQLVSPVQEVNAKWWPKYCAVRSKTSGVGLEAAYNKRDPHSAYNFAHNVLNVCEGTPHRWVLSEQGDSCRSACAHIGSACDLETTLTLVGNEAATEVAAAEAGGTCTKVKGWAYDSGPGICTKSTCCGGTCVNTCVSGATASATCDTKDSSYSRLCACNDKAQG